MVPQLSRSASAGLRIFITLALLFVQFAFAGPPALAVHTDGLFQLDYVTSPTPQGRADVSSTTISPAGNTGDDWDRVYKSVTGLGPAGPSSAFANAFITDGVSTAEASFFTGGGSKDTNDIPQWLYDTTNDVVPDKDDISHAFAAAYDRPSDGHTIVYFGADRFNSGDGSAELGFWFFRDSVTLKPLAPGATSGSFNGAHRVGDLLVLVEFVRGGAVGQINIYAWDGAGGDNLNLLLTRNAADCAIAPTNDTACAVINTVGGETPPWPYIDKDGQTAYQPFAIFEGGIDFTALLGGDIGCFSSFLAETRSSGSSVQAQLKDFALGAFPVCGIKVTKTGDTLSKIGDPVDYTITIENTGRATLFKRNITDTLLGAITTNGVDQANTFVLSNTCGASLAKGATCTITLRRTVQAGDPDPLPNTVSILYSERANFTGLEFTDSDDHTVNLFQPAVMIDKTGDTLSKIGDPVTYTFTITNKSSQDSPNLTLASISDSVIGDLSSQATTAGCDVLIYNEKCSFTVTRTVDSGDSDPLNNTVNVLYHPVGFPNDIKGSDSHSVNLFQPSVEIKKSGDGLSKIGDNVTYSIKINNTSSTDSPNLILDTIVDDVLGNLASFATGCASLAPGASCEFTVPWTVAAVDVNPADGKSDDPVINTITIHFHPDGFPNDISATASHKLNLFQPSIGFSKTADTKLSKVGDKVNYTLALNNTSSADSPDLMCTITDAKLGINKNVTLASGKGDVVNVAYTVQASDPDPLVNTASVSCSPIGFPNVLTASGSWTVNLFQPSVKIEKDGPAYSKAGDTAIYTFKITNTSSTDSPNLKLDSITDDVIGPLGAYAPSSCDNLKAGDSCSFSVNYIVLATDPDPLINKVEVHYHPADFPNDITATASHTTDLLHPTFDVTKDCTTDPVNQGGTASFTITYKNTGDADLIFTPDQADEGGVVTVVAGGTTSVTVTRSVPAGATSVANTVTGKVTLDARYKLANTYTYTASDSCAVKGKVKVIKTVGPNGQPPAAGQVFTFQLRQGASTASDGTILETQGTDAAGLISFTTQLVPGQTYQICEWVFPGWNTNLAGDGPLFVPNSIIPPSLPNPNVNNLTVCADFTVTSGQTRTFTVINDPPPGGRALTIGFWKNWASCANSQGKGQKPMLDQTLAKATIIGDTTDGHSTLPGIVISATSGSYDKFGPTYYLVLHGNPATPNTAPDCLKGIRLLDKSTIDTGRKMASDPAFNLAAQLVAAELNFTAGAGKNATVINAVNEAVLLLGKYQFNGITHTTISAADAARMNQLATILDNYNNNR